MPMPVIDHTALLDIAERVFAAAGSEPDEAQTIADYLVEANLRGHDSHGVGLIPGYLGRLANGGVVANRKGRVVSENGSLIVYDGERAWARSPRARRRWSPSPRRATPASRSSPCATRTISA